VLKERETCGVGRYNVCAMGRRPPIGGRGEIKPGAGLDDMTHKERFLPEKRDLKKTRGKESC